eukprot:6075724-Pyramimonas_sp.AAC.1
MEFARHVHDVVSAHPGLPDNAPVSKLSYNVFDTRDRLLRFRCCRFFYFREVVSPFLVGAERKSCLDYSGAFMFVYAEQNDVVAFLETHDQDADTFALR